MFVHFKKQITTNYRLSSVFIRLNLTIRRPIKFQEAKLDREVTIFFHTPTEKPVYKSFQELPIFMILKINEHETAIHFPLNSWITNLFN